jgi:hypothetical protein
VRSPAEDMCTLHLVAARPDNVGTRLPFGTLQLHHLDIDPQTLHHPPRTRANRSAEGPLFSMWYESLVLQLFCPESPATTRTKSDLDNYVLDCISHCR